MFIVWGEVLSIEIKRFETHEADTELLTVHHQHVVV